MGCCVSPVHVLPFWGRAVGARKEAGDSGLEVGAALLLSSTQVSGAGHKDTCLPRWWQRGPSVKHFAGGGDSGIRQVHVA